MADLSRRTTLAGTAAAGLAALAGGKARADTLPSDEPAALFGTVTGDTVSLPPLHDTAMDLDPPTINVEPPNKRLRIAVGGRRGRLRGVGSRASGDDARSTGGKARRDARAGAANRGDVGTAAWVLNLKFASVPA